MATIRNGILGGISGKVGPVVGVKNGTQYIIRARPRRVKKFTANELENQSKFRLVQNYLSPFLDLLKVGFNNYHTKTGGFRAAVSYTRKNALKQVNEGFYIDAEQLKISGGSLLPVIDPKIRIKADKSVIITWNTESVNYLNKSDQLLLLMYDFDHRCAFYKIFNGAHREEGTIKVEANKRLENKQIDIYIGFVAADRRTQSDSQYLGRYLL